MKLEDISKLKRLKFEAYPQLNQQNQQLRYLIRAFLDVPLEAKDSAQELADSVTDIFSKTKIREIFNSQNSPDFVTRLSKSSGKYVMDLDPGSLGINLDLATPDSPTEIEKLKAQHLADVFNASLKSYLTGLAQQPNASVSNATTQKGSWFRRGQ